MAPTIFLSVPSVLMMPQFLEKSHRTHEISAQETNPDDLTTSARKSISVSFAPLSEEYCRDTGKCTIVMTTAEMWHWRLNSVHSQSDL